MNLWITWIGYKKFALALAGTVLLLTVACSTSEAPAESVSPVLPSDLVNSDSIPVSYSIGNKVGERIPDFAITLVDGRTVTSADLIAQKQPAFLFFFETW